MAAHGQAVPAGHGRHDQPHLRVERAVRRHRHDVPGCRDAGPPQHLLGAGVTDDGRDPARERPGVDRLLGDDHHPLPRLGQLPDQA
ncbi:MAG TPA: hypothetical protein VIL36_10905, partial [Acidimicrobiales bacterium]